MILFSLLFQVAPIATPNLTPVEKAPIWKEIVVDEQTVLTLNNLDDNWILPSKDTINTKLKEEFWNDDFKQSFLSVNSFINEYKNEKRQQKIKEIEEKAIAWEKENERIENLYNSLKKGKIIDKWARYDIKTAKYTSGTCTSYPAVYFDLDQYSTFGNAINWIASAKKAGLIVSDIPIPDSIVIFNNGNSGYHKIYWHAGIVKEVYDKYLVIEDMNYLWNFIVSKRIIPRNNQIKWFIYAPVRK